ncbi:alpha/beta hydrolase-fold protein [Promethearchaeum syntrophicum]|uniref:Alpha/beta hydrolase-fold protein n=1 Tax=Promethearchaeum syntrophicum TaxID=2594042 RepID=A0A5B9DFK8_9ARCH|nr:alpha/beta hydrolase-fold protein [Candidatus Prometheoarchaeum syntrophicum]QEE17570.1 Putative esterase [Candidatus Prometheoarchaeum syntrophicum]
MTNPRYITENFHSQSLERNPLKISADRQFMIYLPPGYYDSEEKRYPVIYLLHGYRQDIKSLIVGSKKYLRNAIPFIYRSIARRILRIIPKYEDLDKKINSQEIKPFILVQPECSLNIPDMNGVLKINGNPAMKGAFYLNSPFTGNFYDYIFDDLIKFVDSKYRTFSDKKNRALMGASMGGYGTLLACLKSPEKFNVGVALSPLISFLDLLELKKIMPLYQLAFGKKKAEYYGKKDVEDVLDTADLIITDNDRLIPTIKRDTAGKIIKMDESIRKKWLEYDIIEIIKKTPQPFSNIKIMINCEIKDEYGFSAQIMKLKTFLAKMEFKHKVDIDIYQNKIAEKLSPHILGIGYHLFPGIYYCLENMS